MMSLFYHTVKEKEKNVNKHRNNRTCNDKRREKLTRFLIENQFQMNEIFEKKSITIGRRTIRPRRIQCLKRKPRQPFFNRSKELSVFLCVFIQADGEYVTAKWNVHILTHVYIHFNNILTNRLRTSSSVFSRLLNNRYMTNSYHIYNARSNARR